jgi:multidrug efflux pump subunit AcrA (membrane-fusion protein)
MRTNTFLSNIIRNWPIGVALIVGAGIAGLFFHDNTDHLQLPVDTVALMETAAKPVNLDPGLIIPLGQGDRIAGPLPNHPHPQGMVEDESVFICPMNCIAPVETPGRCPVCGMDLVEHAIDGHVASIETQSAGMPGMKASAKAQAADGQTVDKKPTGHGMAPDGDGHALGNGAAVHAPQGEGAGSGMRHDAAGHSMAPSVMEVEKGRSGSSDTHAHHHGGMPAGDGPPILRLASDMIEKAGIRVAPVEEKLVSAKIRLYGKIEYDPVDQYKVTAFTPGVVDNVYVRRTGQAVRRGDPLFDLHSAELYYLEEELLKVLKRLPYTFNLYPSKGHVGKRSGRWSKPLYPTAPGKDAEIDPELEKEVMQSIRLIRRKMRMLGLSEKDIDLVIRRAQPTGIATITTPMTGIVLVQNAFRGAYVNTGDVIFTLANPRVLWARLDAYASDFPWIRLGQKATFETDAYPGMRFEGKVVNIDPEFDANQRTFRVGVLFNDKKGLLKPNMLVRSVIHAELKTGGQSATEMVTAGMMKTAKMKRGNHVPLVIPETAPLITGARAVVYVQQPDRPGTFVGREVVLGPRADGYYVVQSGLAKGELVVVNGNFKIDSAIQILARTSMMSTKDGTLPMGHYDQVKAPIEGESLDAREKGPPAPTGRGYQHNDYRGYRDKVQ